MILPDRSNCRKDQLRSRLDPLNLDLDFGWGGAAGAGRGGEGS